MQRRAHIMVMKIKDFRRVVRSLLMPIEGAAHDVALVPSMRRYAGG
jgi:hypothetical protein